MPYKNIIWIKLEKRLLNDYRFYTMSDQSQLLYIKLLLLAAETHNKVPKNPTLIRTATRSQLTDNEIEKCLVEIKNNFPKFKETEQNYYFYDFNGKHNQVRTKTSRGLAQNKPRATLEEEKKREDKEKSRVDTFDNLLNHKLWNTIKSKYPDRDYKFEFEKMMDWWAAKKKKPQSITAFTNWLNNTKPDPVLTSARLSEMQKVEDQKQKEELAKIPPPNPETMNKLRNQINSFKKTGIKTI
jgi:hypothetical protein